MKIAQVLKKLNRITRSLPSTMTQPNGQKKLQHLKARTKLGHFNNKNIGVVIRTPIQITRRQMMKMENSRFFFVCWAS